MTVVGECVQGPGTPRKNGYTQIRINGKNQYAHRVAWALEYGAYPNYPEEVIDHLCRNRACVNVEHMELTTIGDNVLRGDTITARLKAQTECVNGHDLTDCYVTSDGHRQCNECNRARQRKYYDRKKKG